MTTKTDQTPAPARPPSPAASGRRSHVPGDGTAGAAAIERAQKGMLHEARDLKRTRIGADVLSIDLLDEPAARSDHEPAHPAIADEHVGPATQQRDVHAGRVRHAQRVDDVVRCPRFE